MLVSALLDTLACLLLLAGLAVCALNLWMALRSLRRGSHSSMVPLLGSLLMLGGIWLLLRTQEIPWGAALPFLLLDVSTLPSLMLLPFFLLLRALRGKANERPLLPAGLTMGLLVLYMAFAGLLALGSALTLPGMVVEKREAARLRDDTQALCRSCFTLTPGEVEVARYRVRSLAIGGNSLLPAHDAGYEVRGAMRVAPGSLPQQGGTPVPAPAAAADFRRPARSDGQEYPEMPAHLLREGVSGRLLCSPSTGWVYFCLQI